MGDLTKMMDRSMEQLRATETATDSLRSESTRVTDFVGALRARTDGAAARFARDGAGVAGAAPGALAPPAPAVERTDEPDGVSGLS